MANGGSVLRSDNLETIVTGALIVLYTMISTSTANVAVLNLPYLKSEFFNFPNLSLISGFMSAAKILSSFLIFIFPSSNYEIMMVLGTKAIFTTSLSELYRFLPHEAQGTWVGVCMVLLTFSCGSTVARALTITKDEDDTKFLSNCFTVGKSAVHAVELLATTVFYQHFGWDGLVVWISSAYTFVTIATIFMYIHTKVKEKRKIAAREARRAQLSAAVATQVAEHVPQVDQSDVENEGESLLFPESASRLYRASYSTMDEDALERHEEEREWPPKEIRDQVDRRRSRHMSVSSMASILTSISQTRDDNSNYFHLLWKDISKASWAAWLYLFFSESAGMSLAVITLCGTKYLKENWGYNPREASITIVLPQLVVIPVFCLVSLIKIDNFACVIFGNALIAVICMLPFINVWWGWSIVIFVCELFNALRTSSQMPGFNLLVPSPRIARRFISISSLFIFALRTIGYSGGTALYTLDPKYPFIVCGICQIISALILCFLLWVQIPKITEARRMRSPEKASVGKHSVGSMNGNPSASSSASPGGRSDGSRGQEHWVET